MPNELRAFTDTFVSLLWDSSDALVVSAMSDGRLLLFNDAFSDLTGRPRSELTNNASLQAGIWAEPGDRGMLIAILRELGMVEDLPVTIATSNGETRLLHISSRVTAYGGEAVIVTVARDTTEQSRTERLLAMEHDVARVLSGSADQLDAAPKVLGILGKRLDWDFTGFWVTGADQPEMVHSWWSPLRPRLPYPPPTRVSPDGIVATIAWGGDAVWIENISTDPRIPPANRRQVTELRASLTFPVRSAGTVTGVIGCLTRRERERDEAMMESADAIGRLLGLLPLKP
jgi:PAS domain S-box-containing protein